jgi:hypothetical protein
MRGVAQGKHSHPLTRAGRYAALALMVAGGGACSHHIASQMDEQDGPAQLTVDNQEFPDFDIFVVTEAGSRWRLGLATGNSVSTFEIPKAYVDGGAAHLHFIADPVGGQAAQVGEMVVVNPGDDVQLTIAPY